MKFDLEKLKRGEMPITRDGRKVLEAYISDQPIKYSIAAWIEGRADVFSYTKEGVYIDGSISDADLMHSPTPIKIALYLEAGERKAVTSDQYKDFDGKLEALKAEGIYLTTIEAGT